MIRPPPDCWTLAVRSSIAAAAAPSSIGVKLWPAAECVFTAGVLTLTPSTPASSLVLYYHIITSNLARAPLPPSQHAMMVYFCLQMRSATFKLLTHSICLPADLASSYPDLSIAGAGAQQHGAMLDHQCQVIRAPVCGLQA